MHTEQQNTKTTYIDQISTIEMLELINDEDTKVAAAIKKALPYIAVAIDAITQRIRRGGRLIYIGAGTSGRLGVLDAAECPPTFNAPPGLVIGVIAGGKQALTEAIEGAEDNPEAGKNDLMTLNLTDKDSVVGIAASGRTPYVIGGLNYAKEIGAMTIGLACNAPCAVLDAAQIKIGVIVGPEVITGSTRLKAGTAQKMVLNMLSTGTMVKLGKVYGNLMVDVQVKNAKLVERARRIVAQIAEITEDQADMLLQQTGYNVKLAIIISRKGVSLAEAQHLLEAVQGRLSDVIG